MHLRLTFLLSLIGVASCSGPFTVIQTTPTGVIASGPLPSSNTETRFISHQTYKGWPNSWLLSNGRVWAAVVPSTGRVMQLGRVNEDGVFWENPKLIGKRMPSQPWDTAGSFGGDKTWPSPQSAWNWPPPDVFDQEAVTVREVSGALILESKVSPRFGIRTERRVEMDLGQPVLRITTTYHKVQGEPVEVGVWVITQLKNPVDVQLPVPPDSPFADGYVALAGTPGSFAHRTGDQIRFTRDPQAGHKIGNDAGSVTWQDAHQTLTIESPRVPGASYPDQGCSVAVYTNGGEADYVELETMGPMKRLSVGESLTSVNVYRLTAK